MRDETNDAMMNDMDGRGRIAVPAAPPFEEKYASSVLRLRAPITRIPSSFAGMLPSAARFFPLASPETAPSTNGL